MMQVYTVTCGGSAMSEFKDFSSRMTANMKDKAELGTLLQFIWEIADNWGYREENFKSEDNASRIKTPKILWSNANSHFGLRLYCYVVSEHILILFNGDLKTKKANQDCPNCSPHFALAKKLSSAIERDIKKTLLEVSGSELKMEEDYLLNY